MRNYLDVPFEVKELSETGTFSGYGSVFGVEDSYKEIVAPGAFVKSLTNRQPAMLWQHRTTEPIGVWTDINEDQTGLLMSGKLAMKTKRGAEAYELLKMVALNGMSIGFNTIKESLDSKTGVLTLNEIDLWEVSLVTFPANESARVNNVKQIEEIETIKDVERYLRDAGGFSRSQAVGLLSRMKAIAQSDSDAEAQLEELLALVQKRNIF